MTERPAPASRAGFFVSETIATRWADNDLYGHINNAAYYGFIDTAVNRFLIDRAGLDLRASPVIALVVETGCRFHAPLAYPQLIEVALKVERIGTSSVTWRAGIFPAPAAAQDPCAAEGHFVHVLVDRESRRPVPWPDVMRHALEAVAA
jgi:acyl-CoA thioester hydrolase